jgi:hypothetical protein
LATKLHASQNIKTVNVLHLTADYLGGSSEFWTNDSRLAKAAEGIIQIIVPDMAADSG